VLFQHNQVLQVARNYFGCRDLPFVPLENSGSIDGVRWVSRWLVLWVLIIMSLTSPSAAPTGKPEYYTMKLWHPSCLSETVIDTLQAFVVATTWSHSSVGW